jgi:tetratricopeptide (TPR) repeat protein
MILSMNSSKSPLFRLALVGLLWAAPAAAVAAQSSPPIPAGRDLINQLMDQANQRFHETKYADAEKQLEAILQIDPQNAAAEKLYGSSRGAQGDNAGAMTHFKRYLRLAPRTDPGYAALADKVKRYEGQPGHPAVAVSARDLDPVACALAARNEALALKDTAPAQAVARLDEAIRLNERDALAFTLRGDLLLRLGRKAEAQADYKRADILDPNGDESGRRARVTREANGLH